MQTKHGWLRVCLSGMVLSCCAGIQPATAITVTSTNDSGAGSLREAISIAVAGDTIQFDSSLSGKTINLTSGALGISKPLTIQGPGAGQLTIDGKNNGWNDVFDVDAGIRNVQIFGLTIKAGGYYSPIANNGGYLTVAGCTLSGSGSLYTGGIYFDSTSGGSLTVSNCNLSSNYYGIYCDGWLGTTTIRMTITDCSITKNSYSGLYISNNATNLVTSIQGCTISSNGVGDIYSQGIYTVGMMGISGSTISGNGGCGVYSEWPGTTAMTNCTIWGNFGGGTANPWGTYLNLYNCTVAQNTSSSSGGGIYSYSSGGTVTMNNTIVAFNSSSSGPDISGPVNANYCLIGDPTGATISWHAPATNYFGTHATPLDPQIAWLGAYGGPTMPDGTTMMSAPPVLGSPAIDAGSNALIPSGLTTDQRGLPRRANGTVDIGADEYQPPMVTVQANPTNAGSVTGGGTYQSGIYILLSAAASNNWLFTKWNTGATNNPYVIMVPATNVTYTANFAAAATINVGANTNDGGSVTGTGVYFVGSNDVLTATASNNWRFIRWSDGSTNNPRTVMVSAGGTNLTAIFAPTAVITAQANPANGGSVTGGGTYVVGSNVLLTATASNLWRFISWDDTVTNNPRTGVVLPGGGLFTALFQQVGTVSVLANPTNGGSVTGGDQYLVGSNATVTAAASNNWLFINWNGSITNNPWVFSVTSGTTVCTANFAKLSMVTALANPTNAGSVTGGGSYLSGSNITLTASASNSWLFTKWNDNSVVNPRTITVPTTNITYIATFIPPMAVTVRANPTACGSVSGGGTFQVGSNVTISATPVSGWLLTAWNDGNTNASRTITVPASNITYTANFARGIGAAVDATNLTWTTGGNVNWTVQTATTRDGVAALKSGAISAGQQTWFQTTTNGPGSLMFWWKVSSAANNYLQFYIGTQLVSQISGNVDWNQYVGFIGTSNQVTLKWVYTNSTGAASGSNAGWVDQVTWTPCPYAEHVPQMFYQDPSGLLASWVLNGTGGFQFARVLANTGGWKLKAAGDVDGDGVSDLLFETAGGDTGGWFMNADGSYRDARFWFNIGAWEIKACADYEGTTGRGQLFFQTPAGVAAYWRLDTNGNFLSAVQLGNMGAWKLRGAGDLDGDHKAELFWQNAAGQIAIWSHNPDGSIRGAVPFSTGPWALCGVADIDNDGVSDLLWQTPSGDTGGWFMNSNSTARAANFWWNTGAWKLKAAGR